MHPKGGVGVETERSGAEVPVRRAMPREREQEPRCWTFQSQTERRDRGQTEKSWLLFEGVDTSLYEVMRKSKWDVRIPLPRCPLDLPFLHEAGGTMAMRGFDGKPLSVGSW